MLVFLYFLLAGIIAATYAVQYRDCFTDDYSAYIASVAFLFLFWPFAIVIVLMCRDER
jgi:hypothetical protein